MGRQGLGMFPSAYCQVTFQRTALDPPLLLECSQSHSHKFVFAQKINQRPFLTGGYAWWPLFHHGYGKALLLIPWCSYLWSSQPMLHKLECYGLLSHWPEQIWHPLWWESLGHVAQREESFSLLLVGSIGDSVICSFSFLSRLPKAVAARMQQQGKCLVLPHSRVNHRE